MNNKYKNVYGTWHVTTEGDVEGRTTKQLGVYTGYVDEIALFLANKCYYSLRFKPSEQITEFTPTRNSVNVSFDIDSDTWNSVKTEKGLNEIKLAFSDRPVSIHSSNYYASFLIEAKVPIDVETQEKKQKALDKLSDEDKKLLGLK